MRWYDNVMLFPLLLREINYYLHFQEVLCQENVKKDHLKYLNQQPKQLFLWWGQCLYITQYVVFHQVPAFKQFKSYSC